MLRGLVLPLLCLCLSVGCAEANFELADESRLPAWANAPGGPLRQDVAMTIHWYNGSVVFKLWNNRGVELSRCTATIRGEGVLKLAQDGKLELQTNPRVYPSFSIVECNGTVELLEQKRLEPRLYISDDPIARRAAGLGQ